MKFFGRRGRPERSRRPLITGHAWIDPILDAALAELEIGHLRAATTVLAEVRDDPESRDLRLDLLAKQLVGHADEVAELARKNSDPELHLLAGATYWREAATIRGGGWAGDVGDDRFKIVRATAAKALPHLLETAKALAGDPTPWHALMKTAMLLGVEREQHDQLWQEVVDRHPTLWAANQSRLTVLTKKWFGSHEEMFAFAHQVVADAAPGDPVTALIPMATFALYEMESLDTADRDIPALGRGMFGKLLPALIVADDQWLAGERPHVRSIAAHNSFAAAFGLAGQADRTLVHLLGMRDRITPLPWDYLPGAPADEHHSLVMRFWPEDLESPDPGDPELRVPTQ